MRFSFRKKLKRTLRGIATRGFAAAKVSRLLAGWKYDGGFTPQEISSQLGVVRGRAREMAKDSPYMKRYLHLSAINIVGEGFSLKSAPHDGIPGDDGFRIDEKAARFIEWHWRKFCNYRDPATGLTWCDATGRKTDAEIDRLNVKTWKRDGEYFIHVIRTDQNPYGIAWRILRPDFCDHQLNIATLQNGNTVRCGVEMTKDTHRPVAYYFESEQGAYGATMMHGRTVTRIPVSEIIHGFTQEDEDQPRGVPDCHATMVKLKMLDELDEAELTAAREEACSVSTYYAPKGEEGDLIDMFDPENSGAANAMLAEKEPGQSEILPIGYKKEITTPTHPNKEHGAFKSGMLKDVASGMGLEYSGFANDWSKVSFSSVRVGTISERDSWEVMQNDMISQCKTPQFLMWLNSFLSLAVSDNLPIIKYEKFAEHEFRGRRWMWVDPVKDMAAAAVAVDHGWKTNTQIASDMGTDFADNVDEIKRESNTTKGTTLDPALSGSATERAARILGHVAEIEKGNQHEQET